MATSNTMSDPSDAQTIQGWNQSFSDDTAFKNIMIAADFELLTAQKKHQISALENDSYTMKYKLEEMKNSIRLWNDHANENHDLVVGRRLKLIKEHYNICMQDAETEEEKLAFLEIFKEKRSQIINE